MKNIQIVEQADNATYSLFSATEGEFLAIFPGAGQDIEIVEDFVDRVGEPDAMRILSSLWSRPIHKSNAAGIHGTLYYGYEDKRANLPKSKREVDRSPDQLNVAQRTLYKQLRGAKQDK